MGEGSLYTLGEGAQFIRWGKRPIHIRDEGANSYTITSIPSLSKLGTQKWRRDFAIYVFAHINSINFKIHQLIVIRFYDNLFTPACEKLMIYYEAIQYNSNRCKYIRRIYNYTEYLVE